MIDNVISGQFWNGIATAIAVMGGLLAALRWWLRREKALLVDYSIQVLVSPVDVEGVDVVVSSEAGESNSLMRTRFILYNNLRRAVDEREFVGAPFSFHLGSGVVHAIHAVTSGPAVTYDVLKTNDSIELVKISMQREAHFGLEVLHDGCFSHVYSSSPRFEEGIRRYFNSSSHIGDFEYLVISLVSFCVAYASFPLFLDVFLDFFVMTLNMHWLIRGGVLLAPFLAAVIFGILIMIFSFFVLRWRFRKARQHTWEDIFR